MRIDWTGKITDEFYVLGHASVPVYLLDGPSPALFDAGFTSLAQVYEKGIREVLGTRSPSYLFLTHAHWDHIGSAAYFKAVWPQLQIVGSQGARDIVVQPKAVRRIRALNQEAIGALRSWGVPQVYEEKFEPPIFDQVMNPGQTIELGPKTPAQAAGEGLRNQHQSTSSDGLKENGEEEGRKKWFLRKRAAVQQSGKEWAKKSWLRKGQMTREINGPRSILVVENIFETGWINAKSWVRSWWKRLIQQDTSALRWPVKNYTESG